MNKIENGGLISGAVADGFERVAEQFELHLRSGEEKGGAICVTRDGEVVVDLWGGHSDLSRQKPWTSETMCLMYSVTKGLAGIAMLQLQEAGKFDYDQRVSEIWPEFGQNGKSEMTIRTLMNHRGGLAALDRIFSLQESVSPSFSEELAQTLAAQKPLWEPEKGQGYHATTYGMYVGELFRRLCSQPFSEYFREHIAGPLEADVWVGTPEEIEDRIAEVEPPSGFQRLKGMLPHIIKGGTTEGNVGRAFLKPGSVAKRALTNPKLVGGGPELYNAREVRKHPVLWAGGVGTARGLAKIYGALANEGAYGGKRIVERESLLPIYRRQGWSERDQVLGKALGWSQGFLKEEVGMFSDNEESFGHSGLGGSLGWADPVNRISIGYLTNTLDWHVRSPRCIRLCRAVFDAHAGR